ncbi:nucleolar protein 16-like [Macrobrachium nipponense]|uniref:nucleolar protein 16-like n=1 Tax=Macrobrachium nipponense TaxID=159736 RepID=UPI0030C8470B
MGVKSRRKQRKKYRYKVTAKRRQRAQKKLLNPTIESQEIKKNWDNKKSAFSNVDNMGLVFNLNKLKPSKEELITPMDHYEEYSDDDEDTKEVLPTKKKNKDKKKGKVEKNKKEGKVIEHLEKLAAKKIPKQIVGGVRLPKDLVDFATLMLDKHGSDFKAMARDPMNYYQDSWKQIRTKIKHFVTNPRYFAPYLKERNRLKLPDLPPEVELMNGEA